MNVPVAALARGGRTFSNVVRLMAARAVCMRRHVRLCEYDQGGVARATSNRLLPCELVRSMAAHAGRVPAREQSARSHDGLGLGVALGARRSRVRGGRVLLSVTGATRLVGRLTGRRVGRRDARVTARALTRNRFAVLVRAVTIQARRRSVHDYRGDGALGLLVAARAFARSEGIEYSGVGRHPRGVRRAIIGEGMAIHTVGVYARTKALLCYTRRVHDRGSGFVTARATSRRYGAHAGRAELMAGFASDPLLFDVHEMPGDPSVTTPLGLHVDPSAGRATTAVARAGLGATEQRREREQAQPHAAAQPN